MSLIFGQANDVSLTADTPVQTLKSVEWLAVSGTPAVNVPWIGTLTTTGQKANAAQNLAASTGDFMAGLLLSAATSRGLSLGTVNIKGWLSNTNVIAANGIGNVTVGGLSSVQIVAGQGANTEPLFGYPFSMVGVFATGSIDPLKSLKVTGAVSTDGASVLNSIVAAPDLGPVVLVNPQFDNGGEDWGLASLTPLKKLTIRIGKKTYDWATSISIPGAPGDFHAPVV